MILLKAAPLDSLDTLSVFMAPMAVRTQLKVIDSLIFKINQAQRFKIVQFCGFVYFVQSLVQWTTLTDVHHANFSETAIPLFKQNIKILNFHWMITNYLIMQLTPLDGVYFNNSIQFMPPILHSKLHLWLEWGFLHPLYSTSVDKSLVPTFLALFLSPWTWDSLHVPG